MTFAAAALVAWYFAANPTPGSALHPLSSSPLWSGVASRMTHPITQVPITVLPRTTASLFGKQVNRTSPAVFRGTAFESWPDRSKWNLQSILEKARDSKEVKFGALVKCKIHNAGQYYNSLDAAWEGTKKSRMTGAVAPKEMEALFKRPREGKCAEGHFQVATALEKDFPDLPNFFVPNAIAEEVHAHVQSPGVMSPLEYSVGNNFLLQVEGSVEVVLVPASQLDLLYLFPFTSPFRGHAQVGHADGPISIAEFPKFAGAELHYATLQPGDALWIPPFWSFATVARPEQGSVNLQAFSMTPHQELILELVDLPVIEWIDLLADKSTEEQKIFQAGFALARHFNYLRGDDPLSFGQFLRSIVDERFSLLEMHRNAAPMDCPRIREIHPKHPTFSYIQDDIKRATKKFFSFPYAVQISALKDLMELIAKFSSHEWTGNTLKCWAKHAHA